MAYLLIVFIFIKKIQNFHFVKIILNYRFYLEHLNLFIYHSSDVLVEHKSLNFIWLMLSKETFFKKEKNDKNKHKKMRKPWEANGTFVAPSFLP